MSAAENKLAEEIMTANTQEAIFLGGTTEGITGMFPKDNQKRDIILISANKIDKLAQCNQNKVSPSQSQRRG